MELRYFERLLKTNNAIRLNDDYILFNDLELYSFSKKSSVQFKRIKDIYGFKINNKTIEEMISETESFLLTYDGGRGSNSSGPMGGGFNHASDGNRGKSNEPGEMKYPAELNVGGKNRSYEKTLALFKKKYGDADVEYGVTVDDQGFVHKHIKGTSTSVAIGGNQGQMVIHNHPGGGNFSDSDLISVASSREKGIVATSNKRTYSLTKTNKFKSKEFIKAVKKAKWPTQYDYDKGADWWLRRNAKEYGYVYTARK